MFGAFSDLLVYQWLGIDQTSHLSVAVHFFVMDTAKIFLLLFIFIYIMGLLRAMLSPELVRDYVRGKPKWLARSLAIILGAVTPFCSCSSVPLFIGFVEAGIPLGVTFSFLIASPMVNEVAAVILVGILGWQLAALYIGAGLVAAYVGGVVMECFKPEHWVEDYVWKIHMGETQVIECEIHCPVATVSPSVKSKKLLAASGSGYSPAWHWALYSMVMCRKPWWLNTWAVKTTGTRFPVR